MNNITLLMIRLLLLVAFISANDSTPLVIHIQEELAPGIFLLPSISISKHLHWLPTSSIYRPYFMLSSNWSLFTSDQPLDREQLCQSNRCNCSSCWISLNFLETWTTGNASIRTVSILVEDINDHSPTFSKSQLQLTISENVPIGYGIPLQAAVDSDQGTFSEITYQLYPMLNNPFRLISDPKPRLQLIELLDREIQSFYQLKLIARDGGQNPLFGEQIIEIRLTDINDNAPVWNATIYRLSVPEDQPVDSKLIQVFATDRDSGDNGRLHYTVDDPSATFSIDASTGEIFLNRSIDYEKTPQFTVSLIAEDNGQSPLKSYATLMIDVTDVNDCRPTIVLTQMNGEIVNDQHLVQISQCLSEGSSLMNIYLIDKDSGDNGRVECRLNDSRLALIQLTWNTYVCQISEPLWFYHRMEPVIFVQLDCNDFGQPSSLSSSTIFSLKFENCHQHPMQILPLHSSFSIPYETTELPFVITQIIFDDGNSSQLYLFNFNITVDPWLNLTLLNNGNLVLYSMPNELGLFFVNITAFNRKKMLRAMSIPLEIYSINQTEKFVRDRPQATSYSMLIFALFALIFLMSTSIGLSFLIIFLCQKKRWKNNSTSNASSCLSIISSSNQTAFTSNRSHVTDWSCSKKVHQYLTKLPCIVETTNQCHRARPSSMISIQSALSNDQDSLHGCEQFYTFVKPRLSRPIPRSDSFHV